MLVRLPPRLLPLLLFGLLVGAGCRPRTAPPVTMFDEDDPGAGEVADTASPTPAPAAVAPPIPSSDGTVARRDLLEVLDQGVGSFLAGVEIEPYFRDERFAGWEIHSFWPDDPRYAVVGLRSGDVVTRVNGHEIKRPTQLAELWTELREARTIEIAGFRDGAPFLLQLRVVGDPS